jgi:hypothetical protein
MDSLHRLHSGWPSTPKTMAESSILFLDPDSYRASQSYQKIAAKTPDVSDLSGKSVVSPELT